MEARRRQTPECSDEHGRDRLHLTTCAYFRSTSTPSACLIFLLRVLGHSFAGTSTPNAYVCIYILFIRGLWIYYWGPNSKEGNRPCMHLSLSMMTWDVLLKHLPVHCQISRLHTKCLSGYCYGSGKLWHADGCSDLVAFHFISSQWLIKMKIR